ncbi:MAG: hypothetical protein ACYCSN_09955 [Acidobacteriaceae bacterium]
MSRATRVFSTAPKLLSWSLLLLTVASAYGQVSPAEILNPKLKAEEQRYLPQLQALQHSIAVADFAFPLRLARYADARPGQRGASNSEGIEFVYFQQRVVLKISGTYKAAFNAAQLSRNERASRAFQDVVAPILRLVTQQIPPSVDCDGIGFEIVYHTRDASKAYDYEGREALTVVFSRDDAFAYENAKTAQERQQILNRSDIFVNGEDFGLALGQRDPLDPQALERSVPREEREAPSSVQASTVPVAAPAPASAPAPAPAVAPAPSPAPPQPASKPLPASADAKRLQAQFHQQLDAIAKESGAALHLADRSTPSFEASGDQTVLHFTMANTLSFDRNSTSIYKRAAQSFDLFLAPEMKDLLSKLPAGAEFDAFNFSVLDHFGTGNSTPETVDYICPANSVRSFVENRITSQDLINQSMVLVNGVRIALNLQLAE